MLNRHNLNIAKLAAKEQSRFTLNSIRVTPTETMVTDGHLLVRVTQPDMPIDAFPNLEDSGLKIVDTFAPFNLLADKALEAVKALPKKTTIPVLACAAVAVNGDGTTPNVVTNDMENLHVFKSVDGNYPDVERVMPEAKNIKFKIALDPHKVKALMEQFIGLVGNDKVARKVVFEFQDAVTSCKMTATGDGQTMTAVLMPVRL